MRICKRTYIEVDINEARKVCEDPTYHVMLDEFIVGNFVHAFKTSTKLKKDIRALIPQKIWDVIYDARLGGDYRKA